ncbi:MAG: DUF2155 domain-containing protein [Hyphomicrobium sp.]
MKLTFVAGAVVAALFASSGEALADRIENKVAIFSALDKVTATIKRLEVPLNETVPYGALRVTPRACYSRPPTEQPKTTSFVEVDEVQLDGTVKKIFSGWMFAESPGLNAVEHPVFDVWLTECQKPSRTIVQRAPGEEQPPGAVGTEEGGAAPPPDQAPPEDGGDLQRRRVRR